MILYGVKKLYQKTKTYDDKKQGLIIGKGMKLVRIRQRMDFSMSRSRLILDKLLFLVDQISNNLTNDEFYRNRGYLNG